MSKKRYPEEVKIEAGQAGRRAGPSGCRRSRHSLYEWLKRHQHPLAERAESQGLTAEIRHFKAELKRVSDERDILK
ncbi:hypothetical protein GH865_03500 [Rhodocyclus tenuis]|uniref:hypothetical protein n=1 Tax=Rhodocyclus gracilis TaxID=2929842 RepID=UPI001298C82F|nr:hypothetical protein [Rhodocyclus gracilis]MRD72318.1 hypothetical protein [Rhodocyclus gracilis]